MCVRATRGDMHQSKEKETYTQLIFNQLESTVKLGLSSLLQKQQINSSHLCSNKVFGGMEKKRHICQIIKPHEGRYIEFMLMINVNLHFTYFSLKISTTFHIPLFIYKTFLQPIVVAHAYLVSALDKQRQEDHCVAKEIW